MRFLLPVALAILVSHGSAFAQNKDVLRGPVPAWVIPSPLLPVPENASGLAFVRSQDILVHLDEKGQAQYTSIRAKLLHTNALQMGNLTISWNPAAGAPTVHAIKVHRDGEVIDVLPKASFEILRREGQLEEAMLNGNLTAVYRVADLRVGDELEFASTVRANDPTLGADVAAFLMLALNPTPGRYHLGVSWIDGQQPQVKMTDDMAAIVRMNERSLDFLLDNPPLLPLAKDAPARFHWQRRAEFSDFKSWEVISQRFATLYAKAAQLPKDSPLKQDVSRIAANNTSQLDRASAALKLVQQDVRYIYIGLNGGNLTPATAVETWQRRYGDCKGKTVLLMALLNELGIEAEPVLVNNSGFDDGLDERLPNPWMFDHVLVRARIDGVDYYLDGTLPPVARPSVQPVIPYRWTLPLTAKGAALEQLYWHPAKQPEEITLSEIDARAGFGKPAKLKNTTIIRGIAGLRQQVQMSSVPQADLLPVFRQELVGDTWQSVDGVQWRYDVKEQASVMTITGTGPVDWDDDGDGAKSLALPGGGFSPPERRNRSADQNQDLPYYNQPEFSCHVTTVRLPPETQAKHWSFKPGFDDRYFGRNYYRAFELRDGAIRMVRASRIEQREINASVAKADNARIADFDNSMGWIFYDPATPKSAVKSGVSVPATYDLDWTADGSACLSNKTVR